MAAAFGIQFFVLPMDPEACRNQRAGLEPTEVDLNAVPGETHHGEGAGSIHSASTGVHGKNGGMAKDVHLQKDGRLLIDLGESILLTRESAVGEGMGGAQVIR